MGISKIHALIYMKRSFRAHFSEDGRREKTVKEVQPTPPTRTTMRFLCLSFFSLFGTRLYKGSMGRKCLYVIYSAPIVLFSANFNENQSSSSFCICLSINYKK